MAHKMINTNYSSQKSFNYLKKYQYAKPILQKQILHLVTAKYEFDVGAAPHKIKWW